LYHEPTRNINFAIIEQQLEKLSHRKEAVTYVYSKKCCGCQHACKVKEKHRETQGCLLYCTENKPKNPKWIIAFSNPKIAELTVAGAA
jgi:hypothetical protein